MVTINGLEPTENAALAYSHVSELDFEVLDYHRYRCSTRFTCGFRFSSSVSLRYMTLSATCRSFR